MPYRYVYKSHARQDWVWQCNHCWSAKFEYPTQTEAFRGAMIHVLVCLDDNASARYAGANTTPETKETP